MTANRYEAAADAAYADLMRRIRDLEAAKPQESASIQTGMTKVLSPTGTPFAAVGHSAGRSGFLLPSGGSWVTVQEYVSQQVSAIQADLVYLNTQLGVLGGRVDTVDQGLGVANGRIDNVDQRLGVANGRIDNVDGRLINTIARMAAAEGSLSSLSGRMSSAESAHVGLAQTVGSLAQTVVTLAQDLATLRNRFNQHTSHPPGNAGG